MQNLIWKKFSNLGRFPEGIFSGQGAQGFCVKIVYLACANGQNNNMKIGQNLKKKQIGKNEVLQVQKSYRTTCSFFPPL